MALFLLLFLSFKSKLSQNSWAKIYTLSLNIWHFHNSIKLTMNGKIKFYSSYQVQVFTFWKIIFLFDKVPKVSAWDDLQKKIFWKEKRHFGDWVTKYIFSHQTGHDQCDQIGLFVPKVLERKSLNKNSLNIGQLLKVFVTASFFNYCLVVIGIFWQIWLLFFPTSGHTGHAQLFYTLLVFSKLQYFCSVWPIFIIQKEKLLFTLMWIEPAAPMFVTLRLTARPWSFF